jgi:Flp pilus assembly protein TadG
MTASEFNRFRWTVMMTAWTKLTRFLGDFRKACDGNVAITFAFATLPIIGSVGFAVDYSHANSVKVAMQAALDSTALMLSKEAGTDTSGQLQTNAVKYFNALFTRPEATSVTITTTYTVSGGSQVMVNGSANVPTKFLGVIGHQDITVNGSSTAKWGSSRLRVALVLDNTGSMADNGKIDALKSATNNLLTQFKNATSTNGDVYVSIVPFVKDVNVGQSNYNASWIYWTDWDANNQTCSGGGNGNGNGWGNGNGNGNGQNCTPANHNTWNGCVTDRGGANGPVGQNYDTNVLAPVANNKNSLFSAEQYSPCPQAAMGLSYNWSAMTTLVNNMSPGGNTNQAIGLALGWMSLTGGGPFPTPPAMDINYTYQQIIILLTDGLNTQDRWYTSQSSIDARQQLTCNNIKAAGITLYTIQVNTGGDPTSTLLQNCASTSDKFFLLTSANEIVTTFNTIGTNLTKLRVAK